MKQNPHKKLRRQAGTVLVHVPLVILALVWLIPIFWVVMTSFRGNQGSYSSTVLPSSYTLSNYVKLFTDFSVFNLFHCTFCVRPPLYFSGGFFRSPARAWRETGDDGRGLLSAHGAAEPLLVYRRKPPGFWMSRGSLDSEDCAREKPEAPDDSASRRRCKELILAADGGRAYNIVKKRRQYYG